MWMKVLADRVGVSNNFTPGDPIVAFEAQVEARMIPVVTGIIG